MSEQFKLQMRGLIRFSYLSESGFAVSRRGVDAVRDMLYDTDRLERRFALFEALALPSLRVQDDPDFKIGLLIGDDFPLWAHARLEKLIADLPQARLVALPPMQHFQAVKQAIRKLGHDKGATHTLTFRFDDDDAIHRSTTARLRAIAMANAPVRDVAQRFAIGFNRGFYITTGPDGMTLSEEYEKTPLGIGLGLVEPLGKVHTVFRRNHRHLPQYYDTLTEVSRPMYLRSVHRDNDSGARPSGRSGTMAQEQIEETLEADFGLSLDRLRAL
ncbi:putative rhamnosyl transferase [Sulfitobacter sp. S190]|uniref:putative rhamnosyl transferase n=1 Tax=Sulfitobacter sp. S190 TaxID=2867022 RepID=UPI0021A4D4D7|nr:putative rhamnosyl transferase [Sulfitobacter sp. S190]UWR22951.1 putative rhamnosyl transferase [Sulfitobacter sp. S190]